MRRRVVSLALLAVCVVAGLTTCYTRQGGGIVAGSAHLEAIVRALTDGDPAVAIHNLVPAGMCPGHYDMKPSDVAAVAGAQVVLLHDWQQGMPGVKRLVEAANVPPERLHILQVEGNWMTPEAHGRAVQAVAEVLSQQPEADGQVYAERAAGLVEAGRALEEQARRELDKAEVSGMKVVVSEKQAPVLAWAGFDVVGTFGRAEELSVADVEALVALAKEQHISLVVVNLQSGDTEMGKAIAREAGAVHVVLTNFPGGFPGTETWEQALATNVDRLVEAVAKARGGDD